MSIAIPVRVARTARRTRFASALRPLALLAVTTLGAGLALAQSPPPGRSVESLLEIAREKNPEFAAMRYEADAVGDRIGPAGAFPDPAFRIEWRNFTNEGSEAAPSLNPSKVGSTKYTVLQPLPFFGKRDLKREVAEADSEAAMRRADGTWLELATKIKGAYTQYYYNAQTLRLTREVLELLARLESVAQARYSGGLGAQQDAIRAQVEQTALRADLYAQESELARAKTRVNSLIARGPREPLAEPERLRALPPPARLQPADLEERARARNPKLAAEDARIRAADKSVELADRNRYPDFAIGLSPIQSGNRISEWELMLEVAIPLQQDTRRAQESEARAMASAARSRRDATANDTLGELAENLVALETARRIESLAGGSLLPQAELTFQSALAGYESGKVDFTTLLDAQRQIQRAKQERLKAQAEAQMRFADIERIVGEDL
jgi:cobalt-zinc-cadmium efflux system outer membrane protein